MLCGIYFVFIQIQNTSCLDVFIYWDSRLSLHSLVYSALHNLSGRDFNCLLISAVFPISDSTLCDKCSESCYYFQSWIPLGMAWNIPGKRETEMEGARDEFATLVCWLPVFELIGRSTAASRRRRERQRAAAVQLPALPECYKRNCLQRGNWHNTHTHTQTQHRLVARISAGSISPFSCGDFAVITSAVLKRIPRSSKAGGNCTTSGLMRAFQKPFWWTREHMAGKTMAAFLRSWKVCEHERLCRN